MSRPASHALVALVLAALALAGTGCASLPRPGASPAATRAQEDQLRALRALRDLERERERADALERDVERLRTDLVQAESVLVAMESGLKGTHTRAAGVSALAEARVLVERAARAAPSKDAEIHEARAKLTEADFQLREGHVGSAVFFASRARRIAESLLRDARAQRGPRVAGSRANLRATPSTTGAIVAVLPPSTPVVPKTRQGDWVEVQAPSGATGWVHESLLR